jgi:hypothetical protein
MRSGDRQKAQKMYGEFFALWANADEERRCSSSREPRTTASSRTTQ